MDKILKMFCSRLSSTGNVILSQQARGSRRALHSSPYLSGKKVESTCIERPEARRVSQYHSQLYSPSGGNKIWPNPGRYIPHYLKKYHRAQINTLQKILRKLLFFYSKKNTKRKIQNLTSDFPHLNMFKL